MTRRTIAPFVVFAVVSLLALTTGFDALFRMSYVLGIALVGGVLWALTGLRGIAVQNVQLNGRAQVGKPIDNNIIISNHSIFPRHRIEFEQMSDLPGHASVCFVDIPRKRRRGGSRVPGQVPLKTTTVCARRGRFTIGPVMMASSDPLGFFKLKRSFDQRQEIIVHPQIQDIARFQVPFVELRGEKNLRDNSQLMALQASSVREYAQGDSLNRIHWPSTARMGKLMVKEFDIGRYSRLWLIVDMERRVHSGHGAETTDELAASVAASVANRTLMTDMPVGLIAYGPDRCFIPAQRGEKQLEWVLDSLAVLKPEGTVSLDRLLLEEEKFIGKDDSIIIISPSLQTDWVKLLDGLRRRHAGVCALPIDPTGFDNQADNGPLLAELSKQRVQSRLVRKGVPLAEALSSSIDETNAASRQERSRSWTS